MSISLDAFRVKHLMKLPSPIKEFCESKRDLNNGTFYVFRIKNTIHYDTIVTGKFDLYKQYIESTNQHNHSVSIFQTLINTWDTTKIGKIKARVQAYGTFFWVFDGAHRLAILASKQHSIPIEQCEIEYFSCVIDKLKDALRKTTSQTHYNGWNNRTEFGYHSFNLFNISIPGQRNPLKRFEKIKRVYNFTDKVVLDLGCNTGGMLVHIPEIRRGVGVDYDANCIEFCRLLTSFLNYSCSLDYHIHDLNQLDISKFCNDQHLNPDIIFLLSLGSWVKEWKQLYLTCYEQAQDILFETNNDTEGREQIDFFNSLGGCIQCISEQSDDDSTGNFGRKTYLISHPKS